MALMSMQEITDGLGKLKDWELSDNKISKIFIFQNFDEAILYLNKAAEKIEKANHHPNIDIRFNKVKFTLWTHTEEGITDKDFKLARELDSLEK